MPVYVQVAFYVKTQILLKNTFSGERLPSRREIAVQLGVNPNTVQKAFRLMEEEGYVRTSGNQGSVVYFDDRLLKQIEDELTLEMVDEWIASAKELHLTFKKVVDLISDRWDRR